MERPAGILCVTIRSDDSRFHFLAEHKLSITWYDGGPSLTWREERPQPGKAAGYLPISRGKSLEEAVDLAIDRWERQHGKPWP